MSAFAMFSVMWDGVISSKRTLGVALCHRGEHQGFSRGPPAVPPHLQNPQVPGDMPRG